MSQLLLNTYRLCNNSLSPRNRVRLEKLTIPGLVKNSPHFPEQDISLLRSQETATGVCS